ncbi:hypothetical protein M569_07098, partial [Genlisea aurea]
CNFTGISCDERRNIVAVDISGWGLQGKFIEDICSYLPELISLQAAENTFNGGFPFGILNCSRLESLNMSATQLTGALPDFSPLQSLKVLDLSYNLFTGDFPLSITNLSNLEIINVNENQGFNFWQLPENITGMAKLKIMIITSCMVFGEIPPSVGNMTSLVDLELSGNYLTGKIPPEIGRLRNLQQLELYYNQLQGEIPPEIGNMAELINLDMSVNNFTGQIPASICRLPKLRVLQIYNSSLTGSLPVELSYSTTLNTLSLYGNFLTGEIPQDLGKSSALVAIDISENNFTGNLPEGLCSGGKLNYLLALKNNLSGQIPTSYGGCRSLVRFRISNNNLEGRIPEEIFALPHASIIDLSYNNLSGSIPANIQNARNLSELFLQRNRISGVIPSEISSAANLVKIDLSYNLLSGPIPSNIGNLKLLNLMLLQGNQLNSSIPDSLSSLRSLNVLDLSYNQLDGSIPQNLSFILPSSLNFSHNHLTGVIPVEFIQEGLLQSFLDNPGLCVPTPVNSSDFSICHLSSDSKKKVSLIWLMIICLVVVVIGSLLYLKRWIRRQEEGIRDEETLFPPPFSSYEIKSFHRLSFSQREITQGLVDENIVGYGGSGAVYKVELSNGETIAVKKLWTKKVKDYTTKTEESVDDRELKTEVQTLGSIRHKNIVKLYSYFSSSACNLLVYEYMPNGNLWDAIHSEKTALDWPIRHQIAVGIAQGLAYLHHDLMPPIIHRDIKSTNVLLDLNYHPKVADFGIAKIMQCRESSRDSTTTAIAGTYGYLAPEYAYTSKATTKCDVYSFGVVLMELVTGKKPVETEFGENKDIVYWVSSNLETKEEAIKLVDKRVQSSYHDEMIEVLRLAMLCTCKAASTRPTMNDVVRLLLEGDP